jgi:hypothetical protein
MTLAFRGFALKLLFAQSLLAQRITADVAPLSGVLQELVIFAINNLE